MASTPIIFDQTLIRQRRDRHAASAREHDFLLRRVAEDLTERLSIVHRTFASAACVGAYHGVIAETLHRAPNIGNLINVEVSEALLRQCEHAGIAADPESLPIGPEALDLIVSGLALHLVNDLPGMLVQMRRALRPDGLLLIAMLGGESLRELREAWLLAEAEVLGGASPRVAPLADVRELGGLLQRAGFALPVADSDVVVVRYASPLALMRDLRAMAASNMLVERRRIPVTRRLLARACEIYAERSSDADGRVRATFEIITLTGWAPHDRQQKPLQPGSAKVRLADALGVAELPTGDKAPLQKPDSGSGHD